MVETYTCTENVQRPFVKHKCTELNGEYVQTTAGTSTTSRAVITDCFKNDDWGTIFKVLIIIG